MEVFIGFLSIGFISMLIVTFWPEIHYFLYVRKNRNKSFKDLSKEEKLELYKRYVGNEVVEYMQKDRSDKEILKFAKSLKNVKA